MKKIKNFKLPDLQQRGFILLEVLIAVIVVLSITLWYMNTQIHNNDKQLAERISQQIGQILDATTNYYTQEAPATWPPPGLLGPSGSARIIDKNHPLVLRGYLMGTKLLNPFGEPYEFVEPTDPKQIGKYIILQTTLPPGQGYIAQTAAVPLINTTVTKLGDKSWGVSIMMPQPAALFDPTAVKYMTSVKSGTLIDEDNITCLKAEGYITHIFTAVQSCKGEDNGQPIGGCVAYAKKNGDNWNVYMKVLTPSGWQEDLDGTYPSLIQVSLKCVKK